MIRRGSWGKGSSVPLEAVAECLVPGDESRDSAVESGTKGRALNRDLTLPGVFKGGPSSANSTGPNRVAYLKRRWPRPRETAHSRVASVPLSHGVPRLSYDPGPARPLGALVNDRTLSNRRAGDQRPGGRAGSARAGNPPPRLRSPRPRLCRRDRPTDAGLRPPARQTGPGPAISTNHGD